MRAFAIGLLFAVLVSASSPQVKLAKVLPAELNDVLQRPSIISSGNDLVVASFTSAGECTVIVFSSQFELLRMRSFPGSPGDSCKVAGVDSAGDIVVFGVTSSLAFPITFQLPLASGANFVLCLKRSSLELKFSTRFGLGEVRSLAVAPDDSLWVGGFVRRGLPTTADAVQREYSGPDFISDRDRAGFLAKLSAGGGALVYSTYLGGFRDAVGTISVGRDGDVYAAGSRIWKFSSNGRLLWSTWFPLSSAMASGIGPNGDFHVVGATGSYDFYTTPGAFQASPWENQSIFDAGPSTFYPARIVDGFAARFSADGTLVYSTLLGGVGQDILTQVLVDCDSSVFLMGSGSQLFPSKSILATRAISSWFVVAKLLADGRAASFSTFVDIGGRAMARDARGHVVLLAPANFYDTDSAFYVLTETPDRLPRVDSVLHATNPRSALRSTEPAIIAGEGLAEVTAVTVNGLPAVIVSQSDSSLRIDFPPGLPLTDFLSPYTGDLSLLRNGEVLRTIRVAVIVVP